MEIDCNKIKRNPPLDWDRLLPADYDDDRPPELVVKPDPETTDSQTIDIELHCGREEEILKANLLRHEVEIERRKKLQLKKADKGGEESTQLPDHHDDGAGSHGKKISGSKSPSGVVMSALTHDSLNDEKVTPHDSLNDEKMKKIVDVLVTLAISHYDVGKAAEVCYRDLVKAKVLFALPRDMRRSYVLGLLHTQN